MEEAVEKKVELAERKRSLAKRLEKLVMPHSSGSKIYVRSYNSKQEINLDYDQKRYRFAPGAFVMDEKDNLSLCVGVGKVLDGIHGEVPWFLFEESKEIKFFDADRLPENFRRKLVVL